MSLNLSAPLRQPLKNVYNDGTWDYPESNPVSRPGKGTTWSYDPKNKVAHYRVTSPAHGSLDFTMIVNNITNGYMTKGGVHVETTTRVEAHFEKMVITAGKPYRGPAVDPDKILGESLQDPGLIRSLQAALEAYPQPPTQKKSHEALSRS